MSDKHFLFSARTSHEWNRPVCATSVGDKDKKKTKLATYKNFDTPP